MTHGEAVERGGGGEAAWTARPRRCLGSRNLIWQLGGNEIECHEADAHAELGKHLWVPLMCRRRS